MWITKQLLVPIKQYEKKLNEDNGKPHTFFKISALSEISIYNNDIIISEDFISNESYILKCYVF